MHGNGLRNRQDRLLRVLKVVGERPPVVDLVTHAGVGFSGRRARAECPGVNVLELLRDFLDDLRLARRRAGERRQVLADVAAPVRHG